MPITRQKKEVLLQELIDKFSKCNSVVFADYRGLDVAGISDLRKKLREQNAEMKVAKKTLIGIAAKEQKIDNLDESGMEGPVAATFSYEDPLAGIKVLFNFSKQNDNLKLLGGVIDGKAVSPEVIEKYAKLPGKEELLAKLIGSMNAPVSGFVGVLGNLISGFVRVVSAYKDTLPAEAAPAPVKEDKPAEVAETAAPVEVVEDTPAEDTPAEDTPAEEKPVEEVQEEAPAEDENKEEAA
ncbi:50S ribosomal protein L10 [Candidatus Peregrinibacteria bacterium]|nr:50S ribosomal protein L10 [Candidatus Peregrinibacteria bacterium]